MSSRGFFALLVVTVLAVLGAIVAAVQPTLSGADSVRGDPVFAALGPKLGEVGKITVQTPQYSATWEKRDGVWVSTDHGDYPGSKNLVPDLALNLSRMTKVEAKTAQPDWYQYIRVGDPAATPPTGVAHVTVASTGGDVLADAILGVRSHGIPASHTRGGMFLREAGSDQAWLVEGLATVPTELPEWFDTVLDVSGSDVTNFTILQGDKVVYDVKKTDATNGIYTLAQLDPGVAPANSEANSNSLRSTVSAIVGVRAEDIRAATTEAPGPDVRTDRLLTSSGLQVEVTLYPEGDAVWAQFKASAPEGTDAAKQAAEINMRTAKWAFKLDSSHATRLNQPIANLVQNPTAPPPADQPAPVPLDSNGAPILGPQGEAQPGVGITGDQIIPGF